MSDWIVFKNETYDSKWRAIELSSMMVQHSENGALEIWNDNEECYTATHYETAHSTEMAIDKMLRNNQKETER